MDYKRIYKDLISDRQSKPKPIGYSETHHITPRCLGGTDSPENLIALTPEDHYAAHLLLAKIHGGKLWAAVRAMTIAPTGSRNLAKIKSRAMFGVIRRNAAKHHSNQYSGINSPRYSDEVILLKNWEGEEVAGTRKELEAATGLAARAISSLATGSKKSYSGWFCPKHNPFGKKKEDFISDANASGEVLTLYHFDGREWSGTRKDFKSKFNKRFYIQKNSKHCFGWYKSKDDAASHNESLLNRCKSNAAMRGSVSGESNPRADKTKYTFVKVDSGKKLIATRQEMIGLHGIKGDKIGRLIRGEQLSADGWVIEND